MKRVPYLTAELSNLAFLPYKITENFNPTQPFSTVKLNLAHFLTEDETVVALRTTDVFDISMAEYATENSMKFINASRKHSWPPLECQGKKKTEHQILIEFCRCALLESEPRYLHESSNRPINLYCGNLGMGSNETWHVIPDGRVDTIFINRLLLGDDEERYDSDSHLDSSYSVSSTVIEAKTEVKYNNYDQLISTAFIAACINYNVHRVKQTPIIGINNHMFVIVIYYRDKDILLISAPKNISTKGGLSSSGMLLLWLTTNHR